MKLPPLYAFLLMFVMFSCYKETPVAVSVSFEVKAAGDNYTMPVRVTPENCTTGADYYQWTFEGGVPAASNQRQPGEITYNKAGVYTIRLEAWNDGARQEKEYTFTVYPSLIVNFDVEIPINNFAPAELKITNTGSEAASYLWQFDGAETETSTNREPQGIIYRNAGTYTITLNAFNGFETFSISKTIEVQPALDVDFEIIPSFEDEDYESPFKASLQNKTISGLNYLWSCSGGTIPNATSENTEINMSNSGNYNIVLQASNGKETKTATKTVTIKPNSNLYRVSDVKFGVKQAENTLGCYFSLAKRATYISNEVRSADEPFINLVFYSADVSLQFCKFISPTDVSNFDFYPMPNATATYFINDLSATIIVFSGGGFDSMENDSPLQSLNIRNNANSTWFSTVTLPYIILFETSDGRKGAIKIKQAVCNGNESYILTDIKYQKESN
ncbi:MAG: PKD domain-containing protein [Paludibacter sp.]|nr:PKD domain-containing protein [Paludibacter sp.]